LRRAEAEPDREDREEEPGVEGVGGDLEDAVEGDEDGGVLAAPPGQPVPDQHHRDAARDADEDQAGAVVGVVGEEEPGEGEHQERPDDPVEEQGDAEEPPRAADVAQFLVLHARQDGVHHQQEAEGDRQGDGAELEAVERGGEAGNQRAEPEAERPGEDDPDRQEAVEPGETPDDRADGQGAGGEGGVGHGGGLLLAVLSPHPGEQSLATPLPIWERGLLSEAAAWRRQ